MTPDCQYEPELNEVVTIGGRKYVTRETSRPVCRRCAMDKYKTCAVKCLYYQRKDRKNVYFSEVDDLEALLSSEEVELE